VPIEPEDLTPLIDNFCSVQGVIYAICPGSGGYDAIFVLSVKNIK
jgi:phosphomevalonate kinase